MFIVGLNLENADFYIQRNGSEKTCGTPTKEASPDNFGVYVDRKVLLPEFFFYFVMACHQGGYFAPHAHGSIGLKHLRAGDVRDVLRQRLIAAYGQRPAEPEPAPVPAPVAAEAQ